MRRKSNAQTVVEYVILLGVVVGVIIAMRIFLTRQVQEKFRQSADVLGQGEQYAKGVTNVRNLDEAGINFPPPGTDPADHCPFVINKVAALETAVNTQVYDYTDVYGNLHEVRGLRGLAQDYINTAAQMEASAATLEGLGQDATSLRQQAARLRQKAAEKTSLADAKEAEANDYRARYPQCFAAGGGE